MKNNKKENILTKKIIFGFSLLVLFCLSAKISNAAYLTSDQCAASGGSCNWISNNCNSDETSVGLCQGGAFSQGACCKKTLQDTSGADPDPTGTGIGAGGTLQNPNAGLGGPAGGTVTPGTSGIPLNSASPASISSGSGVRNGPTGGLVPCTDNCTLCHLVLGFKNIYDYLLYIVLFPATVLVIVVAGIMYMVSSGNKGMIDKAKSAFTYALTALILALTAWLLINATLNALGFKNAGNWWNFTCDTTQTTGPGTLGAGGATLPGGTGTGKGGGISGKGSDIQVPQDGSKLAQILEKEKSAIYVYGGDPNNRNANGNLNTDCSGWVQTVYKETYGIDIPRGSGEQTNQAFNYSQLVNGTILGSPGHVGIYYNGSVYNNSKTGADVRVVNLDQYLSNHNVTGMRLPPS